MACDFVINGWLHEMELGTMPSFGGLHDPELKGLSADAVYDRIVVDLRRNRKLATFRGFGACDMLEGTPDWWGRDDAISLDDFYRRALAQGLNTHVEQGRGLLPAALLEEVYGDGSWRYHRPEDRPLAEREHLAGFDRRLAGRFEWPAEAPVEEELVSLPLLAPGAAPLASPPSRAATSVTFVHRRGGDLTILWLDFGGNPVPYATIRPGAMTVQSTFVGHTWLLREGNADLGAVVAGERAGRVEIE